jgi:putative aminopeptidase FrvX
MQHLVTEHPALSLFTELLVASPSGREEGVAVIIRQKLDALGYHHNTDGAGNVTVHLGGINPDAGLCILAAHMDEIGVVITRINPDGSLNVDRSGGLYPWKAGEGPMEIVGDGEIRLVGVLSMGSTHTPKASEQVIKWEDCRIITGLTPEELKVAGVRPGSTAVPIRERRGPVVFGAPDDPLVAAWTFDDRMGVVALLRLLETLKQEGIQPYHPTVVAFTVHEEGGGNGAKALAHRLGAETFISVDGSPMPPGAPLELDGRPGIWSKDRLAHYDQRLLGALSEAAEQAGTALQPVTFNAAASDASLVYYAGGAQRIATVGHVRANSHGFEISRLSVFDNLLATLVEFLKVWEG